MPLAQAQKEVQYCTHTNAIYSPVEEIYCAMHMNIHLLHMQCLQYVIQHAQLEMYICMHGCGWFAPHTL